MQKKKWENQFNVTACHSVSVVQVSAVRFLLTSLYCNSFISLLDEVCLSCAFKMFVLIVFFSSKLDYKVTWQKLKDAFRVAGNFVYFFLITNYTYDAKGTN
jgi:hypothetical protein